VGIRSVLAWSDNGALLSQGFAAPLFFAWGNLSLFSIVVVVVVFFFFLWGLWLVFISSQTY
jgi:preprotein translocase subunit SecG